MNKIELRERVAALYGGFEPCNTDKLVDDMRKLLYKYDHRNSEHGVCTALYTYFENKKSEIILLSKHPKYMGEMRVAVDIEIPRTDDSAYTNGVISQIANLGESIKIRVDKSGNRIHDYISVGKKTIRISDMKNENWQPGALMNKDAVCAFSVDGYVKASVDRSKAFASDVRKFRDMDKTLSAENMAEFDDYKAMHLHAGEKTTRSMRKVCEFYGVTTENDEMGNAKVDDNGKKISNKKFESVYAKYADSMSTNARHMIMYVSLNPLDYLTMSFGNSWSSCHTIDKNNKRKMPSGYSGMYCGGTLSYMLDKVSFITFLHDEKPNDIVNDGKIYRCMFHFYEPKQVLIQGRVYPQGNDGATDLYKVIRNKMQAVLAECMGITNTWTKCTLSPADYSGLTSAGSHYKDYECYSGCNISHVSGRDYELGEIDDFTIGHEGICLYCGDRITDSGRVSHNSCMY